MLYIFYGSNISASGDKARSLCNSLKIKRPDAAFVEINSDNWHPTVIEGHLGGQGLFSSKYIVYLNRLGEKSEAEERIIAYMPAMKESDNIFILLEGKVKADLKKALDANGDKVVVTDEVKKSFFDQEFNIFSLADAVGARNSLKAWAIYREAIGRGLEAESIVGTVFWQLKSMAVAAKSKSAGESGLSPFVYAKSKKYSGNYSSIELKDLLGEVIVLYHDGHRGVVDIELGMERMLLKI